MKKLVKNISLAAVALLALSACSSDEDENELIDITTPDKAILNGQWEYSSITANPAVDVNGDGVANVDLYNTNEIPACKLDNAYFFYDYADEGKTFAINEMDISCGDTPVFNTVERGSYYYNEAKQIIELSNGENWKILKADKTDLVVEVELSFNDKNTTLVTMSFKRKTN